VSAPVRAARGRRRLEPIREKPESPRPFCRGRTRPDRSERGDIRIVLECASVRTPCSSTRRQGEARTRWPHPARPDEPIARPTGSRVSSSRLNARHSTDPGGLAPGPARIESNIEEQRPSTSRVRALSALLVARPDRPSSGPCAGRTRPRPRGNHLPSRLRSDGVSRRGIRAGVRAGRRPHGSPHRLNRERLPRRVPPRRVPHRAACPIVGSG